MLVLGIDVVAVVELCLCVFVVIPMRFDDVRDDNVVAAVCTVDVSAVDTQEEFEKLLLLLRLRSPLLMLLLLVVAASAVESRVLSPPIWASSANLPKVIAPSVGRGSVARGTF